MTVVDDGNTAIAADYEVCVFADGGHTAAFDCKPPRTRFRNGHNSSGTHAHERTLLRGNSDSFQKSKKDKVARLNLTDL